MPCLIAGNKKSLGKLIFLILIDHDKRNGGDVLAQMAIFIV